MQGDKTSDIEMADNKNFADKRSVMTISVCMSTYNGEKYIKEQLYSILYQTRKPDEVVICDDASGDHTVEIIRKFIQCHHLESTWKLYENTVNNGYPKNFYYAMGLCKGELVFLSDQDDIWHKKKLEFMSKEIQRHLEAKVICCKFGLIDEKGKKVHSVMTPSYAAGTENLRRISIEDVFYKCEWPGMVVAYRNEWYHDQVMEQTDLIAKEIPHDLLICARAAEENGFFQMDKMLAYHRHHGDNVSGEEHKIGKILDKGRKLREIKKYLLYLNIFTGKNIIKTKKGIAALHRKKQVMEERYNALRSGKISQVLLWIRKNRKDVRLATALGDVLIVKKQDS